MICLVYDKNHNTNGSIVGYVDSNYAGNMDKRRILRRYIFTLSRSAISWKATLNPLLHYLQQKLNTWQWQKLLRKLYGFGFW